MKYIILGGAILIFLTVMKGLFPNTLEFLPLGGSSVSEMGIVFGLAVAVTTLAELWKGKENGEASDHRND